jgi:hypothetical protein
VIRVDSVPTDGTLIPGKSGINVVVAVLEKIYATSDVFSCNWFCIDGRKSLIKEFLRYKAYVDTEFGKSKSPGGIWRVNMKQFERATSHVVQTNGRLNDLGLRLNSSSLQIDWRNVNYSDRDMSIPMYSCLAIMLYLDANVLNPWPHWLVGAQNLARLWARYLDGGEEFIWRENVPELDANLSELNLHIILYIYRHYNCIHNIIIIRKFYFF